MRVKILIILGKRFWCKASFSQVDSTLYKLYPELYQKSYAVGYGFVTVKRTTMRIYKKMMTLSVEYNHDYIQYIHAICDLSTLCLYACIDYEQAILLLFCIDFFRWRESQVRKVVNVMIKQRQAFYTQVEICLSL